MFSKNLSSLCIAHICIPQCRSLMNTYQAFSECLREFCFRSMDQILPHACTYNLKELESETRQMQNSFPILDTRQPRRMMLRETRQMEFSPAYSYSLQGGTGSWKEGFGSPGKPMLPALTEQRTRATSSYIQRTSQKCVEDPPGPSHPC